MLSDWIKPDDKVITSRHTTLNNLRLKKQPTFLITTVSDDSSVNRESPNKNSHRIVIKKQTLSSTLVLGVTSGNKHMFNNSSEHSESSYNDNNSENASSKSSVTINISPLASVLQSRTISTAAVLIRRQRLECMSFTYPHTNTYIDYRAVSSTLYIVYMVRLYSVTPIPSHTLNTNTYISTHIYSKHLQLNLHLAPILQHLTPYFNIQPPYLNT